VSAADRFFRLAVERDEDRRAAYRYLGVLHQDYFHDVGRALGYLERYRALGGLDPEITRRLRLLRVRDPVVSESSAPV
jgi:hypothetical protein